MGKIRKQHSTKTKLEASILMESGKYPLGELCQRYGVHQSVLQRWRRALMDQGQLIFKSREKKSKVNGPGSEDLQRKIGELTMELDFLKKALGK